jgi:hypothetical protein
MAAKVARAEKWYAVVGVVDLLIGLALQCERWELSL